MASKGMCPEAPHLGYHENLRVGNKVLFLLFFIIFHYFFLFIIIFIIFYYFLLIFI